MLKLFIFDSGMLGAMLDLSYNDLLDQDYVMIKAFFAENFVACELKALGYGSLYLWRLRRESNYPLSTIG